MTYISKILPQILPLAIITTFVMSTSTIQADARGEISKSSRLVVTFQTPRDNVLKGVDLSGIVVVKQYGRRLVLDLGRPFDLDDEKKYFKTALKSVQSVEPDYLIGLQQTEMSQIVVDYAPVVTGAKSTDPDVDGASISSATQTPLWNLMDSEPYSIHVEGIWPATNSTPDVVIAVIDTGIAYLAKDLFLNLLDGYDFISDDGISLDWDGRDPDATDPGDWGDMCPTSSWHGTKVASILAARHNNEFGMKGVAQNCSLLPIRVLGLCRWGYATDVADAIVWAAGGAIDGVATNPNPAKIISLSLSGQGECPDYLQSAVNQATALDAIVIAAAGNNNQNVSGYFPANCKDVISVSASTREGKLAAYSNWGNKISVSAPGGDSFNAIMAISVNGLESGLEASYNTGTSFAAPHAAGIISLIRADNEHTIRSYFEIYKSLFLSYMSSVRQNCIDNKCAGVIISPKGLNVPRIYANACQADWDTHPCPGASCLGSCTCPDGYKYYYEVIALVPYEGCVPCTTGTGNYPPAQTCPAGGYFPSSTGPMDSVKWCKCTLCVNGDYCAGDLAPRKDCPVGMYCSKMSTQTVCPKGHFCLSRSVNATKCSPGSYSSSTGLSFCNKCAVGTYAPTEGSETCSSCEKGTFGSEMGLVSCTPCSIGNYSGSIGATACNSCDAGTYAGSNSASVCTICQYGTYSSTISSNICLSCDAGKYSSYQSASVCLICTQGTYTPTIGAQNCTTCPTCAQNGYYMTNCSGTSQGVCTKCINT
jgi:hypothetical protein